MKKARYIIIQKNRGWRGLAEARILDEDRHNIVDSIFSFSQPMWDDMQSGRIVAQDDECFYVFYFDNTDLLPKGQRSVLIKNFDANIVGVNKYKKGEWMKATDPTDYAIIRNFIVNRNNHTTSDWNYIGVRVTPMI